MDTLQQAPALWYWSEPASGYSIEGIFSKCL